MQPLGDGLRGPEQDPEAWRHLAWDGERRSHTATHQRMWRAHVASARGSVQEVGPRLPL